MNVEDALRSVCAGCASYFSYGGRVHPAVQCEWLVHGDAVRDQVSSIDQAIAAAALRPAGELHINGQAVGNVLAVCTVGDVTLCRLHAGSFSRVLIAPVTRELRRY